MKNEFFNKIILYFLIILIPLLFSNSTLDPDVYIRFIATSLIILILSIKYFGDSEFGIQFYKTPLLVVYILFVFWALLRSIHSNNFPDAFFDWLKILLGFTLFYLIYKCIRIKDLKRDLPIAFTLLNIILCICGLFQFIQVLANGSLSIPYSTYQINATFGHRNLFTEILFFSFPFTIYIVITNTNKLYKIIGIIGFIFSLFLLIVLSNRASWLSLLFGIIILFVFQLWFYVRTRFINPFFKKWYVYLLFITVLIFSVIFYISFSKSSTVKQHVKGFVNFEYGSTKDRLELWKRTIKLAQEKPIVGYGLANWKIEMLKFGNKELVSEDLITFYQRPHNDFLWVLSELGIVGLVLFVLIFIISIYLLFGLLKRVTDYDDFLFFSVIFTVLIGYIIYSFFSFPKERIEHTIVLALVLAVIARTNLELTPKKKQTGNFKTLEFLIIGIIIFVFFLIGINRYVSETHARLALQAKMTNNNLEVLNEIDQSESFYYKMDPFSTPLSWYTGNANFNIGNVQIAKIKFEEAYQMNPYHIHILNNLATCYSLSGDNEKAISYYKKGLSIAPNFDEARLNLSAVYFNLGLYSEAYHVLINGFCKKDNPKYIQYMGLIQQKLNKE